MKFQANNALSYYEKHSLEKKKGGKGAMREQCHILEDKSLCKTIRPWGLILHTPNGSFELLEKKIFF